VNGMAATVPASLSARPTRPIVHVSGPGRAARRRTNVLDRAMELA
jgi:hypothetical protein